jgi:hypothetical protein
MVKGVMKGGNGGGGMNVGTLGRGGLEAAPLVVVLAALDASEVLAVVLVADVVVLAELGCCCCCCCPT